jgi:hypothetical protein
MPPRYTDLPRRAPERRSHEKTEDGRAKRKSFNHGPGMCRGSLDHCHSIASDDVPRIAKGEFERPTPDVKTAKEACLVKHQCGYRYQKAALSRPAVICWTWTSSNTGSLSMERCRERDAKAHAKRATIRV